MYIPTIFNHIDTNLYNHFIGDDIKNMKIIEKTIVINNIIDIDDNNIIIIILF